MRIGSGPPFQPITSVVQRVSGQKAQKSWAMPPCRLSSQDLAALRGVATEAALFQITMRRVDGWPTLDRSPTDLDLAA